MSNGIQRCPVCGGRLRLVNVIKVDTFRRPEAKQYDLSVSRRMANKLSKIAPQEMMCVSCASRFAKDSVSEVSSVQSVATPAQSGSTSAAKARRKSNAVDNVVTTLLLLLGFVALTVLAYFTYKYSETLLGYGAQLVKWIENAIGSVGNLKK